MVGWLVPAKFLRITYHETIRHYKSNQLPPFGLRRHGFAFEQEEEEIDMLADKEN